jgi:hypothetical protein
MVHVMNNFFLFALAYCSKQYIRALDSRSYAVILKVSTNVILNSINSTAVAVAAVLYHGTCFVGGSLHFRLGLGPIFGAGHHKCHDFESLASNKTL